MAVEHTFKYLLSGREVIDTRELTPAKAIRYNCLDCSGGTVAEVRDCHIATCPCWPFRDGKPHTGRKQNSKSFTKAHGVINKNATEIVGA